MMLGRRTLLIVIVSLVTNSICMGWHLHAGSEWQVGLNALAIGYLAGWACGLVRE